MGIALGFYKHFIAIIQTQHIAWIWLVVAHRVENLVKVGPQGLAKMQNGKKIIKLFLLILLVSLAAISFSILLPNDLRKQIKSSEVTVYSIDRKDLKQALKIKLNNEHLFLDTNSPGKPCVIPKEIFSLFTYGETKSVEPREKNDAYPFPDWNAQITSMVEEDRKRIFIYQDLFIVEDRHGNLTRYRMKGKTLGERVVYLVDKYCRR